MEAPREPCSDHTAREGNILLNRLEQEPKLRLCRVVADLRVVVGEDRAQLLALDVVAGPGDLVRQRLEARREHYGFPTKAMVPAATPRATFHS